MKRGAAFLSWLLLLALAVPAMAERINFGTFPRRPAAAGFRMKLSCDAVGGSGYHPYYLTFTPLKGKFLGDREIQVVLTPHSPYVLSSVAFRYNIKIPAGGTHNETIYVPSYIRWERVGVRLFEGGDAIDAGGGFTGSRTDLRCHYAEHNCAIGIVEPRDAKAQKQWWQKYPDTRSMVTVLGNGPMPENQSASLNNKASKQFAEKVQPAWIQFRTIEEDRLHDSWLGYSQLDAMLIAMPVLMRIEKEKPDQLAEITKWIASGGNLWVYGAGNDRADFLQSVSFAPTDPWMVPGKSQEASYMSLNKADDKSSISYQPYQGVVKESGVYSYLSTRTTSDGTKRGVIFEQLQKSKSPMAASVPPSEISQSLGLSKFGNGQVLWLKDNAPFPGSFQLWRTIEQAHRIRPTGHSPQGVNRLHWHARTGIDIFNIQEIYWSMLIGSVGQPPVIWFVFLNAMFVIIVGPVCYLIFRRKGRLYLLFFVAPALALLITISLFIYAALRDGFHSRLRARQVTWLDTENGVSTTETRGTYFRVLFDSSLTVGNDSAIYPLNYESPNRYYRTYNNSASAKGQIAFEEDDQVLSGSLLPPREQVQYFSIRPQTNQKGLEFDLTSSSKTVTNQTAYNLKRLLIHDADGTIWQASVKAGETAELSKLNGNPATALGNQPLELSKYIPQLSINYYGTVGRSRPVTMNATSVLETEVNEMLSALPKGYFIADAAIDENLLGLEGVSLHECEHIIAGKLP